MINWLLQYGARAYDYVVQSDNGDNENVDDNVDLPGNVDALPTEIGEPGLGDGGRWDHCTRPARWLLIDEENAEKNNKIAEDENGQKWRRPPVMEAVDACLERVGLPARTSSPVT